MIEKDNSGALVDLDSVEIAKLKNREIVELEVTKTDILKYVEWKKKSMVKLNNDPYDSQDEHLS